MRRPHFVGRRRSNRVLCGVALATVGCMCVGAPDVYAQEDDPLGPELTAADDSSVDAGEARAADPAGTGAGGEQFPSDTLSSGQEPGARGEQDSADQESASPGDAENELEVTVGAGVLLWYNHPLEGNDEPFFEIFEARLNLDASLGIYGLHVTPRFRDTRERGFFVGTTWVEQAYVSARFGAAVLKVGKVYRQFGRFWDNSFYGNTQEYDGLKLDPNHGVSLEGVLGAEGNLGLTFFAQYFVIDGTANYALPDRDTHTIAGDHRRNQVVGRIEPFLKLGDSITLKLGASGEFFQADIAALGKKNVSRFAGDATVAIGGLSLWGEYTWQFGRHVAGYPIVPVAADGLNPAVPGRSSDSNQYLLAGAELKIDWIALRYNYNQVNYSELSIRESMHEPGVSVWLDERLMLLLEWVYWQEHTPAQVNLVNHSLNLTIHGMFADTI